MMVESGTALPQALARIYARTNASPQARGAMQDIAYRTMRQVGTAQALVHLLTPRDPEPPLLNALLCCALGLLCQSADTAGVAPYEEFTLVDQAVSAASSDPNLARAKGMVNALLRRFIRERDTLLQEARKKPIAEWNYPGWWIDAAKAAYPQQWQAILEAGNVQPPLTLRVNKRLSSVASYMETLASKTIAARQVGPDAICLAKPMPVGQIPGFDQGLVSVQDAAAQLAAPLLELSDGMRVLDACAAPGGKTCHILESADVDMIALDHDAQRLARIEQNLQRLHLQAKLLAGDARGKTWWDGKKFDRILADVPCTASGIVRRHPDIRWLRRKADSAQLATLSGQILDNLWQMLHPNGKLLFVTCSLWPQESEAQAAAFAMRNRAIRLSAPGQLLPTASAEKDHDGLFYALFQKPAEG
jgi:16S rRNA (cytosine967-C5)-methyltransferase